MELSENFEIIYAPSNSVDDRIKIHVYIMFKSELDSMKSAGPPDLVKRAYLD